MSTTVTTEMVERGGIALVNADALEPYDRDDGRWRPGVLAEAVLRAAVTPEAKAKIADVLYVYCPIRNPEPTDDEIKRWAMNVADEILAAIGLSA
jgi:hypothetical protein